MVPEGRLRDVWKIVVENKARFHQLLLERYVLFFFFFLRLFSPPYIQFFSVLIVVFILFRWTGKSLVE